jgi:hypothetical protein
MDTMPSRKPRRRNQNARKPAARISVFLNIPYDEAFENLLLAYISAISAFGFAPRATLEIPFGERRLDRAQDDQSTKVNSRGQECPRDTSITLATLNART